MQIAIRSCLRAVGTVLTLTCLAPVQSYADEPPSAIQSATDLPEPTKPRWNGLYIGGSGAFGYGSTGNTFNVVLGDQVYTADPFVPSANKVSDTGYLLGPRIGYSLQLGSFVTGAQVDLSFGAITSNDKLSGTYLAQIPFLLQQDTTLNWLGTLRGNIGFVPADNLLVYATGGLAIGNRSDESTLVFPSTGVDYNGRRSSTQAGWVLGAGLKYALTDRWAADLEYLHYDLGGGTTAGYQSGQFPFHTQSDFKMDSNIIRLSIDYALGNPAGTEQPEADQGAAGEAQANHPFRPFFAGIEYEVGTRYWFNTGNFRYKLYPSNGSALVSRLTYSRLDSHAGEIFLRVENRQGVFLTGYLGVGTGSAGTLKDEDFPPGISPYSATLSRQNNGEIQYGTVDAGLDVIPGLSVQTLNLPGLKAGPFLGYGYFKHVENAYGCTEVATNAGVCAGASGNVLAISEDATWNVGRVGVAADLGLARNFRLTAAAAWVPFGGMDGNDRHWLRLNNPTQGAGDLSGPIVQSGRVTGAQIDVATHYRITAATDIGLGFRFCQLNAKGTSVFQPVQGQSRPQPSTFSIEKYGPFAQVSLTF